MKDVEQDMENYAVMGLIRHRLTKFVLLICKFLFHQTLYKK